jgi:hypothetical protein
VPETGDGGIEMSDEVISFLWRLGDGGPFQGGTLLVHLPPESRPAEIFDRKSKGIEEPAGEFLMGRHFAGSLSEENEDNLHGVFSELSIAKLPKRGCKNPAGMPINDSVECVVGFFVRVCEKQLLIAGRLGHWDSSYNRFHVRGWNRCDLNYYEMRRESPIRKEESGLPRSNEA